MDFSLILHSNNKHSGRIYQLNETIAQNNIPALVVYGSRLGFTKLCFQQRKLWLRPEQKLQTEKSPVT
jgi:hypothetical protein